MMQRYASKRLSKKERRVDALAVPEKVDMLTVETGHGLGAEKRQKLVSWFKRDVYKRQGEDAVLRLNGKRIMLRSAISWSFWPVNGIFPSEELAERQIRIAKELSLIHIYRGLSVISPCLIFGETVCW